MTESLVLSAAGAILGLWLADACVHAVIRSSSTGIPRTGALAMDGPILLLALGLSMGTAFLFGFASLGRPRQTVCMDRQHRGGRARKWRLAAASRPQRTRHGPGCRAVMLVLGAGLLVQTVYHLTRADAGFDRARLVTFSLTLPMANSDPDTRAQAYRRILDGLSALPGVPGAAAMSGSPPNRTPDAISTPVENYSAEDGRPSLAIDYYQLVIGDLFPDDGHPDCRRPRL
ncbi:MAG: hypothetical protein QM757_00740 [Paludibaculum sp.]